MRLAFLVSSSPLTCYSMEGVVGVLAMKAWYSTNFSSAFGDAKEMLACNIIAMIGLLRPRRP